MPSRPSAPKRRSTSDSAAKGQKSEIPTCGEKYQFTNNDGKPCQQQVRGWAQGRPRPCWWHSGGKSNTPSALDNWDISDEVLERMAAPGHLDSADLTIHRSSDGALVPEIVATYLTAHDSLDLPSPMLWGPPGIGKTEMVKQACEEHGYEVRSLNLAMMDTLDLAGVPVPMEEEMPTGKTDAAETDAAEEADAKSVLTLQYAMPPVVQQIIRDVEAGHKVALFLDELNHASHAVMNALYPVLLVDENGERRIGDHYLPAGVKVICAGNPPSYNEYTTELPAPVKDRIASYQVEPNYAAWVDYMNKRGNDSLDEAIDAVNTASRDGMDGNPGFDNALEHLEVARVMSEKVMPAMLTYLGGAETDKKKLPKNFLNLKADDAGPAAEDARSTTAAPTPRSWTRFADQLSAATIEAVRGQRKLRRGLVRDEATSCLGPTVGAEFSKFYMEAADLPDPDNVLRSMDSKDMGKNLAQATFQAHRLTRYVGELGEPEPYERAVKIAMELRDNAWNIGDQPVGPLGEMMLHHLVADDDMKNLAHQLSKETREEMQKRQISTMGFLLKKPKKAE